MELKHSFTVPVPLDRAWDVLLDVERVAACMPGASLDSVDGDDIAGKIKVKVGPITQVYAGKAHFTERDREAHVVVLEASGRETRGSGTASATVRSELVPDGDQTEVTVLTNLNVTGKAAQFGRGVLAEVSGKLVGIFADNMARMLAAEQAGASTEAEAEEEVAEEDQILAAAEPTGEYPGASEADRPRAGSAAAGSGEPEDADLSGDDLAQPIEELALPIRAYNSLRRDGVHTVADLVAKTPAQLLAMDNIGPASVEDIRQRLADRGLSLAPAADVDPATGGRAEAPAGTEALASANGSGGPAGAFPAHAASGTTAEGASSESSVSGGSVSGGSVSGGSVSGGSVSGGSASGSSAPGSSAPGGAGPGGTAPLRPVPAPAPESWQPDNDAVDLLSVAGLPVLKRALPVAAGVVALTAIALAYRSLRRRRAG
jgi:carbon monoxide dehydrogenase subunit G